MFFSFFTTVCLKRFVEIWGTALAMRLVRGRTQLFISVEICCYRAVYCTPQRTDRLRNPDLVLKKMFQISFSKMSALNVTFRFVFGGENLVKNAK